MRATRYARLRWILAFVLLTLTAAPGATRLVNAASPAKSTEILWDTWGIPHIFAPDHPSLF
jgi:acyl-homoserine lactone acylase PvdQ